MITYIRSSSYNNWDFCEMQTFLTYVLGYRFPAGKKADMGTTAHKVLECLAIIKKAIQDNPKVKFIEDEQLGKIEINEHLLTTCTMSKADVDLINKSRKSKDVYKHPCLLKYNTKRKGLDYVNDLIERAMAYYAEKSVHTFTRAEVNHVYNFVWMALEYKNGAYDPRLLNIVAPELNFDIEIDKPWARYEYISPQGDELKGNLAIKGTIDLITRNKHGIMEIVDWKGLTTDTLIPTSYGLRTMGELEIGDIVYDEDFQATKVIAKSQKSYKPCYRIIFNDGEGEVVCDNEHLWKLASGLVVPILKLKIGDMIKKIDFGYWIITNIEEVGYFETQCISVDSPTSTYLCTKDRIPTHNTGQRLNWATGEVKTYDKLCKDPQLLFYHYAARKLFPLEPQIMMSIFFIRDGGPFSVCFEDKDLDLFEGMLKDRYLEMKNSKHPKMLSYNQTDFRCTRLCPFYKNKYDGKDDKNMCLKTNEAIKSEGVDFVINTMSNPEHKIDVYNAPGE